ncbi:S-adenosyl-L-methionine-dependent methyltransferase [Imleria badia]|nr:S-adenosyl-L-methionine-dependent methyltransferase [Imleria badia]
MAVARKRTRRSLSPVPDSDDDRQPPPPPRRTSPERPVVHVTTEHEFPEGPDVQIIGETDPLDNERDNDVPVRVLTDFSIYDTTTLELVPVARLLELSNDTLSFSATGCVKAWIDNDDQDDDDDDGDDKDQDDAEQERENSDDDDPTAADRIQRLKLTPIKRFTFHDLKECRRRLDSNIYILTEYAWYILDVPSPLYKPFYITFWLSHRVLHLVVSSAISTPRLSYDDFIRSLDVSLASDDDVAVSLKILGRSITQEDVESEDVKSYLLAILSDLQAIEHINLRRTPLFRSLFGHQQYEFEPETKSSSSSRSRPQSRLSSGDLERQVLEHRNQTVVTTVVARVTKLLFEQNIKLANILAQEDIDMDAPQPAHPSLVHLANPNSVKWGLPTDHPSYYQSVCVDGVVYSIGDTVMVEPGIDENKARAKSYTHEPAQSPNSLANSRWFCRICYLFEDDQGHKMFHGQWLTHSSKTLLQELGHSQALYLMLTDCENIHIDAISQKCNVRDLDPDAPEPIDGNAAEENDFFTGLLYNSADASFVSLPEEQRMRAFAHCDAHQQCLSCGFQEMKSSTAHPRPLPGGGFAQHEYMYHVNDFVYVKRKQAHSVYKIGQIIKLKAMKVPIEMTVRIFGRYDDVVRRVRAEDKHRLLASDDRRLFKTDEVEIVHDEDLQGQCYVVHARDTDTIDEWVRHDDHYYVNQQACSLKPKSLDGLQNWPKSEFKSCKKCYEEREELLEQQSVLLQRHGRLRGLELFSGAGGLGTGFDLSGFVETRWAIEFSPSAAQTYQRNHPETIVYNQCTNLCLQHAIDTQDNKKPKPLLSLDDKKPLPPMPKRGDVDFIYGGPPCQSFSLMNHNKKEFDIRSTLVCNMLGYVEFYRPSYILLENVFGILCHSQKTTLRENGIQFAVVKFIQRALASIGYQSKFAVLQAAQYGAPQGRKRVIFWGARRDVLMPEWPIPTHCSPIKLIRAGLPTGGVLLPIIRNKCEGGLDDDRSAPLHFVTIDEAIGDLPPFDWTNPHVIMKATAEDKREARERKDVLKIPTLCPLEVSKPPFVGFSQPRKHSSEPLTRYQKWMRQRRDGSINQDLKYHYTRRWRHNVAERVCAVPLVAGANQFSLPAKLRMQLAKQKEAETKYASLYKRLDGDHVFATALTTVAPNSKGGTVLHPSQKRILSVQECARAQGFPDNYEFLSANDAPTKIVKDQLRQIGNAVPVPLAYALGKSLGQTLFKMWDEMDREGSPEV